MTGARAELRRLPWWLAAAVVLLALAVLAVRGAGLAVLVLVDSAERLELAVSAVVGISPLGTGVWQLPGDTAAGWTPPGGAR